MILAAVITSNAQTYEAKDIAGKYQFKVTWMTYIETNCQIKRNGRYKLKENFEGKVQKSDGTWEISGDTLILFPETGSLCMERKIPIWIDSLRNVQIGNFKRSRQKNKINSFAGINNSIGWFAIWDFSTNDWLLDKGNLEELKKRYLQYISGI